MKRDLEEEECELKNREKLKDENLSFLKHQMDNNQLKKELVAYEMQKQEYEELQDQINNENLKDKKFKNEYKAKVQDNLNFIQNQIEQKRKELLKDAYLTKEEAKINHIQTQKIDFENPTKDLVSGLPGFVRPADRVQQL